jgi:hypothetical protein
MAKQTANTLTALTVAKNGALHVSWVDGTGKWNGPVPISPPNFAPPGAAIAMAKQTANTLTALTVGNNGALHVSWVDGVGKWNGPAPISQPNLYAPGTGVATDKQTNNQLTAVAVAKNGALQVSWVVGTGKWNGPVPISPAVIQPPPGAPAQPTQPSQATLDRDGDRLPDVWEVNGLDINNDKKVDLDLKALGARPDRKDLFVEVDYMQFHKPSDLALRHVTGNFSTAPVPNPGQPPGINLHILVDEQIPHQGTTDYSQFQTIKRNSFGTPAERASPNANAILAAKKDVFHYSVFAHDQPAPNAGSSGNSFLIPNMDFMVSLGGPSSSWGDSNGDGHADGSITEQEGTFMHELGHNLGLEHGGRDAMNCKPNYLSIMSYTFQFETPVLNRPLDYARTPPLNPLNENNGLNEPNGIAASTPPARMTAYAPRPPSDGSPNALGLRQVGQAFDWNNNNLFNDVGVNADLNSLASLGGPPGCRNTPNEMLTGNEDWSRLIYTFAGQGIAGGASGASGIKQKPAPTEMTGRDVAAMNLMLLGRINEAIRELPPQSFSQPGELSDQSMVTQIDPLVNDIATLLRTDQVDSAINQLSELRATADSSLGGVAADDIITNPAAQEEVVERINYLMRVLEKQK